MMLAHHPLAAASACEFCFPSLVSTSGDSSLGGAGAQEQGQLGEMSSLEGVLVRGPGPAVGA